MFNDCTKIIRLRMIYIWVFSAVSYFVVVVVYIKCVQLLAIHFNIRHESVLLKLYRLYICVCMKNLIEVMRQQQ